MNVLDRLIASVAPVAGLRRAQARQALALVRDYDAATKGRRGTSFRGRGTSANSEVGPALSTLRDRARDLVRNTPHGARMLDVLVGHVVGTGITVVWNTGSDRTDRLARSAWEEWSRAADVTGGDFAGLQALALRSAIEGGDCLLRFVDRPLAAGRRVPLALQGLEGDHIDETRDGWGAAEHSRLGVRLGEWGEPISYWVRPRHPGETGAITTGSAQSTEVSAVDAIHLYRRLRFGQVRGITWLAPILMTARDLADLFEAVIVKAKIEASFAAFIKQADGAARPMLGQGETQSASSDRIERIRPGAVAYLAPGEDVTFANPTSSGQFGEVSISTLQAMSVGVGLTYDQVTGDLRQANYSSLRAGKIEQRRLVEQIQWLMLAPQLMDPTVARFLDRGLLAGAIPGRRAGYAYELVMPRVEPIDPKKDLEADILAVRSGAMTPQQFTAGWGVDWRDNLDAFAQWFEAVDTGRMVFDIDPRRTTQSGASNSAAATDQGQTP